MLLPSILRTVVPLVAGWILVTLTGAGFTVDSNSARAAVTLAVTAAYYVVFRLVERLAEKFGGPAWVRAAAGVLLGYARPPRYRPTDDVADLVRQGRP
jgi:hypothetical protein